MIIKIFNNNAEKQSSHSFRQKQVVLGRNPKIQSNVLIDLESVSRSHLKISLKNGKIRILDLNSSNGTFLNGKQIPKSQKIQIQSTDQIKLANQDGYITVQLRDDEKRRKSSSYQSSNSSTLRGRSRQKARHRRLRTQIAESTLKMLRSMTADKKSKEQRVKFLKLMGYHKAEEDWQAIQEMIKSKKSFYLNKVNKKISDQLEKQFSLSRPAHEKRGLGK